MPFRIYVVPVLTVVGPHSTSRVPKYFYWTEAVITPGSYGLVGYGGEPWVLVGADLSPADDATIVGEPDAFAFPFDLTPQLTAPQVTNVRAKLEAANLPGGWISTADTWAGVFRGVAGMCTFAQRFKGLYETTNPGTGAAPSLFGAGVTLDTLFGAMPAAVQDAIIATANDQGIPTTGLTASTPLRAILRTMADAYSTKVYDFNGVLV